MEMKRLILILMVAMSSQVFAHDEGHGPKQSVAPNRGGVVSAVVKKADAGKGAKADLVYRAELIRTEGNVQIFLYKKELNKDGRLDPLDLAAFDKKASATLSAKVKGKYKDTPLTLEQKENSFVGKMPKPEGKPYNIDLTVKEGATELLTAFDNLD
jgi:hypothetical protein